MEEHKQVTNEKLTSVDRKRNILGIVFLLAPLQQ